MNRMVWEMDREARKEADITDILRFWETADGVPEELGQYLAVAADEIAGLREQNSYLRKIIDAAGPRF